MPSFRDLSTLAAFDPMPTRLGPVKRPFDPSKPLFDAAALAAHNFERTPHELHSRESGSAGSITGRLWLDESTALSAAAGSEELLRPVLSYGDQRDSGEGQRGHSDEGRPQAGDRLDPGNSGSGVVRPSLETKAGFEQLKLESQAGKTRWTSAARFALTPGQFAEFKDKLCRLGVLETDKPLNLYSKQLKVIDTVRMPAVRWYLFHAFYNGEHLLA